MLFYFTATGNCLYAAQQLDENIISIPRALKEGKLNYEDETIGFVFPDYAGEMPKIVREFIEKGTFKADYIYSVATYGREYSVVAKWSMEFMKEHGVDCRYSDVLLMVDNYLPSFDMLEEKAIDKHIPEQIEKLKTNIAARKEGYAEPSEHGLAAYDIVSKRDPKFNNGSSIYVTDACVGCGICTIVCPRGNFYLKDRKAARHSSTCEFCLACVHHCSQKAIKLAYLDKNPEERYINPEIRLADIIKANNQN